MTKVASEIYDSVSEYGKISTVIGAVTSTFIGVIMLGIGIFLLAKKRVLTEHVTGSIVSIQNGKCEYIPSKFDPNTNQATSSEWNCTITVSYTVNGVSYSLVDTRRTPTHHQVGDVLTVYYSKSDPGASSVSSDDYRICGAVLLCAALCTVTIAWVWVWLTQKYKVAAAASGASSIASLFTRRA